MFLLKIRMISLEGTKKEDFSFFPLPIFQISVIRQKEGETHKFSAGYMMDISGRWYEKSTCFSVISKCRTTE